MSSFEDQRVEEQDVHFKVYNRGKPVMIARYVRATQKADVEFIDKKRSPVCRKKILNGKIFPDFSVRESTGASQSFHWKRSNREKEKWQQTICT